MQINISNFNNILGLEIESIKNDFLKRYLVNLRKIDEVESLKIRDFFSELIESICVGDLDKSFNICNNFIEFNSELSIPYVTLTHELMNLEKLIMEKLFLKNAKDEVYELYKLTLHLEDIIAKIYLDEYIKYLYERNNFRISSLNDIYEKNIISYYKAHLNWLNDLAKSVENKDLDLFPETNHTLCTFGKWLISSGKMVIQNNSKYSNLLKMHESLHFMSRQIKDLIKEEDKNHIILTYLEKCEMLSLSLGTELALIDNTLIISNSTKDPLTGALNRQKIDQLYHNQLEISLATSEPFVLAMCDLDFFKSINDSYGHVAGDKILQSFVPLAKKSLRSSDMVIRYGGEEFVLILPAIRLDKAKDILNKIRTDFSDYILEHEMKKISTTLSMGVIEIDPENCDGFLKKFENAISIVDKKLYKAKEEGRNKIC